MCPEWFFSSKIHFPIAMKQVNWMRSEKIWNRSSSIRLQSIAKLSKASQNYREVKTLKRVEWGYLFTYLILHRRLTARFPSIFILKQLTLQTAYALFIQYRDSCFMSLQRAVGRVSCNYPGRGSSLEFRSCRRTCTARNRNPVWRDQR